MQTRTLMGVLTLAFSLAACATGSHSPPTAVSQGIPRGNPGQDLAAMCKRLAPELSDSGFIKNFQGTARVLVDGDFFSNEGALAVNQSVLANRMRVELNKASRGRMLFTGSIPGTVADLRLSGRTSSFSLPGGDGQVQTFMRVFLQMVDLETGVNVWSGSYEFALSPADGIINR